jgi:hypothetical protein
MAAVARGVSQALTDAVSWQGVPRCPVGGCRSAPLPPDGDGVAFRAGVLDRKRFGRLVADGFRPAALDGAKGRVRLWGALGRTVAAGRCFEI